METDRHFPQRQDIPDQIIAGLGRRSEAAFEAVAQESTHGGSPQPLARVRPRHGRESVLRLVVFFGFQPATDVQPSTRSLRRRVSRPIRTRRSAAGSPGGASKLRALMSDLRLRLSLPQRVCIVVQSAISRANCLARCNLTTRLCPSACITNNSLRVLVPWHGRCALPFQRRRRRGRSERAVAQSQQGPPGGDERKARARGPRSNRAKVQRVPSGHNLAGANMPPGVTALGPAAAEHPDDLAGPHRRADLPFVKESKRKQKS